jgi:ABC-type glycerol-3-phosphate transport system permease component
MAILFLVFVLTWNEYLFAVTLASSEAMTITPWITGQLSIKEAQVGAETSEGSHVSAAATLMVVPLIIAAVFVHRAFAKLATWT